VISKLLSLINKADRKNIKPYATNNIRYDSPNKNPIPAFFRNWSLYILSNFYEYFFSILSS
jgi:hypothetical protein